MSKFDLIFLQRVSKIITLDLELRSCTKWWCFIGSCSWRVMFAIWPLYIPPSLYQTAIWPVDWTQGQVIGRREKNGGRLGQCLWGKVRGYGPLTTHVKAWLTHPASSKWESLQPPPAICPHLHIRQKGQMTERRIWCKTDTMAHCYHRLLWSGFCFFVRRLAFLHSHLNLSSKLLKSVPQNKNFKKKYVSNYLLSGVVCHTYSGWGGSLDRWYRQRR